MVRWLCARRLLLFHQNREDVHQKLVSGQLVFHFCISSPFPRSPWVRHSSHWTPDFPCSEWRRCQAPQLALAGKLWWRQPYWHVALTCCSRISINQVSRIRQTKCVCVTNLAVSRSPYSTRRMVRGGTLVEDLWSLPTGSWQLLTASSMRSGCTPSWERRIRRCSQNLVYTTRLFLFILF